MGRRKIMTTIYLEPEQHEALKQISEETEVPMAALIRRGVNLLLYKRGVRDPGTLKRDPAGR